MMLHTVCHETHQSFPRAFVWKPSSVPTIIRIEPDDMKRLDDGQFLNDILIEFGLK